MQFIRVVGRYIASYKLLIGIFALAVTIEAAYAVAAPLSLRYLVDDAFVPKDLQVFVLILGLLLLGGTLNVAAGMAGDYAIGKLSGTAIRKLRAELFEHLQLQSSSFYQRYRVGDLVTRFSSDMSTMERAIRSSSPLFLREALNVALGLAMLFAIDWRLTLAMLAGSTLLFAGPRLLQRRVEAANVNYREAQERFANSVDETAKGHRTIRSLHQQARFRERAERQIRDLFTFGLKLHMGNALMERLPLTALLILNGVMIGFGGYLIIHDGMSVGSFMAFFTLFMSLGQAGANLSYLVPSLIESNVSLRRIAEILDRKPDVAEAPQPQDLPASDVAVRLEGVTFGYAEGDDQLKNVSLHIPNGSYAAFVGPSGSGKSTALQLISRDYDPREGTVSIGGLDLRLASEASLRMQAATVSQDTFLFHGTIRDNLMLDRDDLSEKEMIEAAKQARIHEAIAGWPDGYDTQVFQGGGTLSGGERQRLSIARAILRKPKLLLLDEATSALDPAAEADINRLIQELRPGRTIVSVTHRLASVANADRIYVFQSGRIAESGTHEELLRRQGLYRDLWDKQNGFRLSGDGLHATVSADWLAKLPFFAGIARPLLGDIASLFSTESCEEGDRIVREGEEGHKFYIIVRGRFEVLKLSPDGEARRVAVLQDGDYFGEVALLRNIPRTATVRAMGAAVLLSVRREPFHRIAADHPSVRESLEAVLASRQ
ncbi:ABC transporter transmembrane domain-containing protein [Paenibacillaceae bacterium WGS1546]|uniref:ABC transporter transmembrane domain-containing protein n=1 Tax=Cohnella sp. WGS1546 TaxID=3366810 RepID=UPI00372D729B